MVSTRELGVKLLGSLIEQLKIPIASAYVSQSADFETLIRHGWDGLRGGGKEGIHCYTAKNKW